jgi:hypothetical protein
MADGLRCCDNQSLMSWLYAIKCTYKSTGLSSQGNFHHMAAVKVHSRSTSASVPVEHYMPPSTGFSRQAHCIHFACIFCRRVSWW